MNIVTHTLFLPTRRIVVVLENRISVFNFTRNPQELHQIDTAPNPRGTYPYPIRVHVSGTHSACACMYVHMYMYTTSVQL